MVDLPRSVGCLGLVMRAVAVVIALLGVGFGSAVALLGLAMGGALGLLACGAIGLLLCGLFGVAALSLWARSRIMERWSTGTVGIYPVASPRPSWLDNDLQW